MRISSRTVPQKAVIVTEYKSMLLMPQSVAGIRPADHVAPSILKSWQECRRQAAVVRSV
jgi:hypothetical protein